MVHSDTRLALSDNRQRMPIVLQLIFTDLKLTIFSVRAQTLSG